MPKSPHLEPPCPAPIRPSGARRLNLDMRARLDQADGFCGLPPGTAKPLRFLAAFQEAEPYLGLPSHAYKLVALLVRWTRPCDWERGSRPIAWPSARMQQEFLGLSPARVKHLNRMLFEAGIFVIRDNEQGKRYGRRDPATGRIVEAYGFDLSPLALRYDEFIRIAAAAKVERQRMKALRRRATLARRAIRQAGDELVVQGQLPENWAQLDHDVAELALAGRRATTSEELGLVVKALERRKAEAEERVRELIKAVETNPEGLENEPHQYTSTTLTPVDPSDTVIAQQGSSRGGKTDPLSSPSERRDNPERHLNLKPGQLVELAPRLGSYLRRSPDQPAWPEIVDAAEWLSGELGVSRTLWAHACGVMGRGLAAVALAFVTTRPEGHFTSGPAGYFAGMVKKAEKGELHLDRTLWKLREAKWGKRRSATRH
jgi:replication initiation protein RepC